MRCYLGFAKTQYRYIHVVRCVYARKQSEGAGPRTNRRPFFILLQLLALVKMKKWEEGVRFSEKYFAPTKVRLIDSLCPHPAGDDPLHERV